MSQRTADTLKLGVLACADVARYAILDVAPLVPSCRIQAIASRSSEKAECWARRWSIEHWHGDYRELMQREDVDAVYIPLPNSLHFKWALRALEAGKAVICEKPGATSAAEASALAAASDSYKLAVVEAYHYRYHPLFHHVRDELRSKRYGELRELTVRFAVPRRLLGAGNIRLQASLGGGALLDPGCYCLDFIVAILEEPAQVDAAQAVLNESGLDIEIRAQLSTASGTSIDIHSSLNSSEADIDITVRIVLDRAVIEIENLFLPHLEHFFTVNEKGRTGIWQFDRTSSYEYQLRAICDGLLNKQRLPTDIRANIGTYRLIDAISRKAGLTSRT